jgi:hypothetical protein
VDEPRKQASQTQRLNLEQAVEESSDVVQVDFRRRQDQSHAAVAVAKPVWTAIAEVEAWMEEREKSAARRWIPGTLFVAGALINWWLTDGPTWDPNFGKLLMLMALLYFAFSEVEAFLQKLKLERLHYQNDCSLRTWLSSGAPEEAFHSLQDLVLQDEAAVSLRSEKNSRAAKRERIAEEVESVWREVRHEQFERASGRYIEG